MALKQPQSMEELVYFTQRSIGKGKVKCWVFKGKCPKCGKGIMGKPINEKTGGVKIRAKEYVCVECGYQAGKEYEDTLTASIEYTCPKCGKTGETQASFKRKKIKIFDEETQKSISADAIIFECEKCKNKIPITKKMKK